MLKLWQKARAGINHERLGPELEPLLERVTCRGGAASLSPSSLGTVAHVLARIGGVVGRPRALDSVAAQVVARPSEFSPQDLANVVWAIAKGAEAESQARGARSSGSSPAARHRRRFAAALEAMQREAQRRPGEFEARHLPYVSFDRCEADPYLLLPQPGHIAAVLWAHAALSQPARGLFLSLGAQVPRRAADFSPSELANTAWAFAKLRHSANSEAVFRAVEVQVLQRPQEFGEQELSNIAWAFGSRCLSTSPSASSFPLPEMSARNLALGLMTCCFALRSGAALPPD